MSWSSCSVALACSLSPHILRTLGNKVGVQTILLVIKNHSQTEKKEIIPSVSEKRGSIMSFYFKLRANNRNMVGRVDWDRIMITTFIHYLLFGSCLVARFFFFAVRLGLVISYNWRQVARSVHTMANFLGATMDATFTRYSNYILGGFHAARF